MACTVKRICLKSALAEIWMDFVFIHFLGYLTLWQSFTSMYNPVATTELYTHPPLKNFLVHAFYFYRPKHSTEKKPHPYPPFLF